MSGISTEVKEEITYQTMAEFLEGAPPNQLINISDLWENKRTSTGSHYDNFLWTPEIQLHCSHEKCNGVRFFRCVSGRNLTVAKREILFYVKYRCSNCQEITKTFALAVYADTDSEFCGRCYKFGELPTYGPPVPSKLIKLIGPDREIFLKGRVCENQGLGIGAFIYYRRVVENQKNRILDKIINVSEKIGVTEDKILQLKSAVEETQFSKALEMAKDLMPESLLINGHSPIALLHSALGKGVHELTDEKCLELAGSIRVVLGELSEKLSQALKDEAELTRALSVLMNE